MDEKQASTMLAPARLTRKILRRVFAKIQINRTTGCWNWTGALDPHYGLVSYHYRHEKAHRFMYAWLVEPLPRGEAGRGATPLTVDHLCRNRACCNPAHLEAVSQRENVLRGESVVAEGARQTVCRRGHPFRPIPRNPAHRYCPTCDSERKKARMHGPSREYWLQKARESQARQYAKRRALRTA